MKRKIYLKKILHNDVMLYSYEVWIDDVRVHQSKPLQEDPEDAKKDAEYWLETYGKFFKKNTKHTQGKWSVNMGQTPLGETGDYMPYVNIMANNICIADLPVDNHGYEYEDEAEANAQRIVTAVNSHDELKALAEYLVALLTQLAKERELKLPEATFLIKAELVLKNSPL